VADLDVLGHGLGPLDPLDPHLPDDKHDIRCVRSRNCRISLAPCSLTELSRTIADSISLRGTRSVAWRRKGT
jgi:hypothetical protein